MKGMEGVSCWSLPLSEMLESFRDEIIHLRDSIRSKHSSLLSNFPALWSQDAISDQMMLRFLMGTGLKGSAAVREAEQLYIKAFKWRTEHLEVVEAALTSSGGGKVCDLLDCDKSGSAQLVLAECFPTSYHVNPLAPYRGVLISRIGLANLTAVHSAVSVDGLSDYLKFCCEVGFWRNFHATAQHAYTATVPPTYMGVCPRGGKEGDSRAECCSEMQIPAPREVTTADQAEDQQQQHQRHCHYFYSTSFIIDLSHLGWRSMNADLTKHLLVFDQLLTTAEWLHPSTIHKVFIHNPPSWITPLWTFSKGVLGKAAQERMVVLPKIPPLKQLREPQCSSTPDTARGEGRGSASQASLKGLGDASGLPELMEAFGNSVDHLPGFMGGRCRCNGGGCVVNCALDATVPSPNPLNAKKPPQLRRNSTGHDGEGKHKSDFVTRAPRVVARLDGLNAWTAHAHVDGILRHASSNQTPPPPPCRRASTPQRGVSLSISDNSTISGGSNSPKKYKECILINTERKDDLADQAVFPSSIRSVGIRDNILPLDEDEPGTGYQENDENTAETSLLDKKKQRREATLIDSAESTKAVLTSPTIALLKLRENSTADTDLS